jgi:acyl-CoA synthetase (AMP-forming)/AMP-acid ligase II
MAGCTRGDLGRLDDDGFLFLTGRKKDLCKSANGKYVAPVPIEEMLAAHKGLEHAVLCVDGRKFVSALLSADTVALRRRMLEKDFQGTLEEFRDGPFRASVQRHVDRVNAKLDSWARVRKWAFVEQFTVATGELTPTLKVRRNEVLRRNAPDPGGSLPGVATAEERAEKSPKMRPGTTSRGPARSQRELPFAHLCRTSSSSATSPRTLSPSTWVTPSGSSPTSPMSSR